MSYIVKTKKPIESVPEGKQAEPIERNGQKLYQFETDNGYVRYSWKYIQNNKDIFDVSRSQK